METQSLATRVAQTDETALMTVAAVKGRLDAVQDLMRSAMTKDGDYGVIPGTGTKPTLLKPGAEKLCTLFRLAPTYDTQIVDLGHGHRECRISCTLTHIPTAAVWGQGLASCSTMETKYRWRKGERKCPKCGKAAIIKGKEEFGGGWVCWTRKDGCDSKFADTDAAIISQDVGRVENVDIADQYNTVLKMATKRALVAAVLNVTGASAIFTQDIEDGLTGDDAMAEIEDDANRYRRPNNHANKQKSAKPPTAAERMLAPLSIEDARQIAWRELIAKTGHMNKEERLAAWNATTKAYARTMSGSSMGVDDWQTLANQIAEYGVIDPVPAAG